jgi:hypothetical protein
MCFEERAVVLLVGMNSERTRLKLVTYAWKGRSQTIGGCGRSALDNSSDAKKLVLKWIARRKEG